MSHRKDHTIKLSADDFDAINKTLATAEAKSMELRAALKKKKQELEELGKAEIASEKDETEHNAEEN